MDYDHLLSEIEGFIGQSFDQQRGYAYPFHNISHIYDVVKAADEIADFYKLAKEYRFILKSAAFFHDVGYIQDGPKDHEVKSAMIANRFFEPFSLPAHTLNSIENCIMATRNKQHPTTFLEAIMCDADLLHFGKEKFEELNLNMYAEITKLRKFKLDEGVWAAISLNFLEQHRFHTDYVRSTYDFGKQKNIKALKNKLAYFQL
ncbi:HD domain-containing protein [Sphingobacterium deserti]|uniref:Metal-dependent phosphohydrolase HD sub domain n=1 Tax=Sphingobacterium deserti TaxID=1229276 RepID=A0A0B8T376_9SPHI|nr:HD domain-containing protein [Sphingobacterium deserti]KGE15947.1 metal-dependent phosphohydrolase HD sub domain [Sphingobacterium deserti]